MIDGLDANDLRFERLVRFGQKPQKLQLCSRRADHENLASGSQRSGDVSEEVIAITRVLLLGAGAFWVPMKMMLGRGDRLGLELFCVEPKNARFLMVERCTVAAASKL